jgi:Zn-dependent peptidase ImmA (M78 family)/DNA-binding XRE family transcriptional regulator
MNISEKLKLARKHSGLTLRQVSDRVGIDDSCLSSYENGHTQPRLSQLSKIAMVYHLPLSFFFEESNSITTQAVLWRNKPENEKEIQAEFLQLCCQYKQLELWANERPNRPLPDLDEHENVLEYKEASILSNRVRDVMGLGKYPGKSLQVTLEEVYGIKVFHLDLGDLGTAACAKSPFFGNAILLNVRCSQWRRNHDLAHELFHLLTWERYQHQSGICEPDQQEEKLATCFAGNLLLPYESVLESIYKLTDKEKKITLSQLDSVARQFDVSLESLLWRMHFLFYWKEEQTRGYIEEAKEYVRQTQRIDSPRPSLYPERYRALAIRVFRKGEISMRRFAQLMGISRKEAEQYMDRDVDHEIPTPAA